MADRLWVYVSDERAGHLDNDRGSLSFQYDSAARVPVSVRLPIREEPYGDSQCRPVRRRQKLFRDLAALIADDARRVIASLASRPGR